MYYILHHIPSILKPRQITTKAERSIPINPCATRHTFSCCTVPASLQGWTGFNFCLVSRTLGARWGQYWCFSFSWVHFVMSDTWSNIQAHKKQLDSLRERLQRRRKDPAQLSAGRFRPGSAQLKLVLIPKGVVPPIYLTLRILTQVCSALQPSRLCKLPCYGDIVFLWCSKRQITNRKAY